MQFKIILTLLALVVLPLAVVGHKKCYALAMEGWFPSSHARPIGGGPQNAYTMGVLNAIWKRLAKEDRAYNVITGSTLEPILT